MTNSKISHFLSKYSKNTFCINLSHNIQRSFIIRKFQFSNFNGDCRYTNPKNLELSTYRLFSRISNSWIRRKKNYEIVGIGKVGSKRDVPSYIPKPVYSTTGIDVDKGDHIEILNDVEVKHMRQSCSLAKIVLDEVEKSINIGVMTEELDAIAHNTCINFGAYPSPLNYRGFPKSICTSVNNVACHGIPDDRKLKDGDIISVDISVFYKGFHGDCAATYLVGNVDNKAKKLVEVAALCLQKAIDICRHEQHFCTIGKTISNIARSHGFSVVPAFCGHGISSIFHCAPRILHYDNNDKGQMLKGMIFTIEPVICEGEPDILILEDGWTATTEDRGRSAQFEHTVLITQDGAEILTVPNVFKIHE
ncbi:methionine aminopeptidase 1D, mitochondrial [Trichonephila clavipes]|nr:methionine aminopeptidase 1D, mitochondrial [Trichonephila clavipes]